MSSQSWEKFQIMRQAGFNVTETIRRREEQRQNLFYRYQQFDAVAMLIKNLVDNEIEEQMADSKGDFESALEQMYCIPKMNEIVEIVNREYEDHRKQLDVPESIRSNSITMQAELCYKRYIIELFLVKVKINRLLEKGYSKEDVIKVFSAHKSLANRGTRDDYDSPFSIQARIRFEMRRKMKDLFGITDLKKESGADKPRKEFQLVMYQVASKMLAQQEKQNRAEHQINSNNNITPADVESGCENR